jgi:hypothetical protein
LNTATGAISGTPTNAGVYSVTITAANTTGSTTNDLNVVIYYGAAPVPVITSALSASGAVGTSFNYAITATNNPTGYFAIGLPSGLAFNPANGGITGAPLVAGLFSVTIRASNMGGTGSNNLTLNIGAEPFPEIEASAMPDGVILSFLTLVTHHYSVEWTDELNNTNWTDLVGGLIGNGMTNTITDATTNLAERFYRLQVLTP